MKDWLGNEYGVGDKVVYGASSSHSVSMVLAEVVQIWDVYRDPDHYEWAVLAPGELPPFEQRWNRDLRIYEDTGERVKTHTRVQVMPIRSTRWKHHGKDRKVTLTIIENITKWTGEVPDVEEEE